MKEKGRMPGSFDGTLRKTEWSGAAILMHWMRNIIEDRQLDLGMPDVDAVADDRKRPDLSIYESRRSRQVLCVIEAKLPAVDVFDPELKDKARAKANKHKAKYFATTNFRTLVWWKTKESNDPTLPEEQQMAERYTLSEVEDVGAIEEFRFSLSIKTALERFLTQLQAVHSGREPEPRHAVDEFLVYRLSNTVGALARLYRPIIEDRCHKDAAFLKNLKRWFTEQVWSFGWQDTDFNKAARQTAYLLVNKILFYNLLQAKRPSELDPLEIPAGLTKGSMLQKTLQNYFDEVLKIDYETIYTADFIDTAAFPDSKEVVTEVTKLVRVLRQYDFSTLGFDIIGRIFERLIPQEERHSLGQYFTSPDVVDLILGFCLRHENDKVLDPACGAGTFLVRTYQHKKLMNQRLAHLEVLETLWGNDISKLPAALSTINLAINDLTVDENYPNIIKEDFFALAVGADGFDLPTSVRKRRLVTLGKDGREVTYPRWFDSIVGNPPYTRQEEIPEIGVDKAKLIEQALTLGGRKLASISKRAGIHAYFFVHGYKFLREGGRFGFIVSNSWLDVDYGKGLQEFFLSNYKIVAIIESKVERWFEDADVNTCIVILEKCAAKKERDANLARFVYLKRPLRHFIPPAQNMWEKQAERLRSMRQLIETALAHDRLYENDDLRVFPKRQKDLWDEAFDSEKHEFVGAKWSKYLRAPEIFFKILERGKGRLVPLKEVARIRRGFTTGANEFFYLTEDEIRRWRIERQFWMHRDSSGKWVPNYVVKSPRECKSITIDPGMLKYRVLLIHRNKEELEGTNVLRYIKACERKGYHKRPTCAARGERWYDLGEKTPSDGFWIYVLNDRYVAFNNMASGVYADCELFDIIARKTDRRYVTAYLNSTLTTLLSEIGGRTVLGQGALKTQVYEVQGFLVPDPELVNRTLRKRLAAALKTMSSRSIGSIFEELGADTPAGVALDKAKPDRRELDRIVMGEILGLSEEEQLEVYRAVVDLVRSRISRAESVGKKSRVKDGMDIEALRGTIIERVKEDAGQ